MKTIAQKVLQLQRAASHLSSPQQIQALQEFADVAASSKAELIDHLLFFSAWDVTSSLVLHKITGAFPVKEESRGNPSKIAKDWIEWYWAGEAESLRVAREELAQDKKQLEEEMAQEKKRIEEQEKHEKQYPEHTKMRRVKRDSQICGEFLEWLLEEKQWQICTMDHDPVFLNLEQLLAERFEIDLRKIGAEKDAMLEEMRQTTERNAG